MRFFFFVHFCLAFSQLDPTALARRSLLVPVADTVDAATGRPAESYPHGYLARVKTFAPLLAQVWHEAHTTSLFEKM